MYLCIILLKGIQSNKTLYFMTASGSIQSLNEQGQDTENENLPDIDYHSVKKASLVFEGVKS
jgi:hypothetical protein